MHSQSIFHSTCEQLGIVRLNVTAYAIVSCDCGRLLTNSGSNEFETLRSILASKTVGFYSDRQYARHRCDPLLTVDEYIIAASCICLCL